MIPSGWYYRHTRSSNANRFRNRSHFFDALRHETDAFGRRLTVSDQESVCGRVKPGRLLDFASPTRSDDSCQLCLRAMEL